MAVPPQSPSVARSRYVSSFQSSIFEPLPTRQGDGFIPAGKRRDQTTSEMFGSHDEKDLRSVPKTFVPKDDTIHARQRMLQSLRSEVLPASEYLTTAGTGPLRPPPDVHEGQIERQQRINAHQDEDGVVDPTMRKQVDLSSKLFGRSTPAVSAEQMNSTARLVPNDYSWHSHPENLRQGAEEAMTHSDRAYQQKCSSGVLNYQSPKVGARSSAAEQELRAEELAGDLKRRSNVYYSDLFGRSAPQQVHEDGGRRPRTAPDSELKHIIHQDWANAKTELLNSSRSPRPAAPSARRYDELHQARIFHQEASSWEPKDRVGVAFHDNTHKVKMQPGMTCQQVHQAHLKSSITPAEFYEEAESTKHWEVVELHLSGLPLNADDGMVRSLCLGFDLQIVRAVADVDPVRNLCKGRAKIMVRYNPLRDSINGLVRKLEELNYRVDM